MVNPVSILMQLAVALSFKHEIITNVPINFNFNFFFLSIIKMLGLGVFALVNTEQELTESEPSSRPIGSN
jgi:hypothetical protein